MGEKTKIGLGIAGGASALELLGDGLLHAILWGLNVLLFIFALATGFLVLTLLNALNPDALIVQTNLARAGAGKQLDARYLASLSADAVSPLKAALPRFPETDRFTIEKNLLMHRAGPASKGWHTYNLSRSRARAAVAGLRVETRSGAKNSREDG